MLTVFVPTGALEGAGEIEPLDVDRFFAPEAVPIQAIMMITAAIKAGNKLLFMVMSLT